MRTAFTEPGLTGGAGRTEFGQYPSPSVGVIGFHVIGHEVKGKVGDDGWKPVVVRIEDDSPAAALPHVMHGSKGDASP